MADPQSRRILLVEDDPALALGLVDALEFEGFAVTHTRSGAEGIQVARESHPDCIILDLMLPDTNGYRVCEQIDHTMRSFNLMLTARSQEADKIRGLDAGADDYVTKPFGVGELVARIRAIFRRTSRTQITEAPIRIGAALIDPAAQTMKRSGSMTSLSFYEVQLLKVLFERAGQVVSREDILDKVWGVDAGPNNRTVDNCVVKLRKKLEPHPDKPVHILTVYGLGYKLVV